VSPSGEINRVRRFFNARLDTILLPYESRFSRENRKQPASMHHLEGKVFSRITDKGKAEEKGSEDPIMALYLHSDRRERI
jgi:hypothetical protein